MERHKLAEKHERYQHETSTPGALVSGFDGHVEDYYHYLSNEVYEWVTLALVDCCPSGRVVSVLEGGYSLEARVSRAKAAQQVWIALSMLVNSVDGTCGPK